MSSEQETTNDVKAKEKALSNVVVLEQIIGFLPLTDMRSCRLVNSTWLDAATAKLRKVKSNRPAIRNAEGVRSFLELWGTDNAIVGRSRPPPPFTRIWLDMKYVHCEEALLNSFFKTVAPFIAGLKLFVSLTNPLHIFRNQEVNERLSYPKLTDLFVLVTTEFEGNVPEGVDLIYKPLICGILENAPNVRRCVFSFNENSCCKYSHWMIDTLKERKCGHKKIKIFRIQSDMEDVHYSRMVAELPELKLESVSVISSTNYFVVKKNQDGVFRFLQGQSESLKFLYLRYIIGCFENFGVPTMEKLETLYVEGWKPLHVNAQGQQIYWQVETESVPSVDYAKQLPALKKILLADFYSDEWMLFMPCHGSPPVLSVEVLKLPIDVKRAANLEHCIRTFPNLRILRIRADVEYANLVYKYLPLLEELILDTRGSTNIDDIITGFSTEECAQVGRFTEKMLRCLPFKFEEVDPEKEVPVAEGTLVQRPISVLKELKVLRLGASSPRDIAELTKVSSRLVLAKMESLQRLDLGRRSPRALELFAEVIQDMEKAGKEVRFRDVSIDDDNYQSDSEEDDDDQYDHQDDEG